MGPPPRLAAAGASPQVGLGAPPLLGHTSLGCILRHTVLRFPSGPRLAGGDGFGKKARRQGGPHCGWNSVSQNSDHLVLVNRTSFENVWQV